MPRIQKSSAFTLVELFIVLAILGVIATFTIPKVLQSQQNSKKTAIFKEVISSLYQITETGVREGVLSPTSTDTAQGAYFLSKLNLVKSCNTDSLAEGCWSATQGDIAYDDDERGGIMHNGATVVGWGDNIGNIGRESITIDWNGNDGPNSFGDDQIRIDMCFRVGQAGTCFIDAAYSRVPYPLYQIGPMSGASVTLWGQIFGG